jgi:TPR repeat protein
VRRGRVLIGAAAALVFAAGAAESRHLRRLDDDRVMALAIDAVDGRSVAARAQLQAAAMLGDVAAMRVYGTVLAHGDAQERGRGLVLLERAAQRGDRRSQRQLGEIYLGREPGAAQADPKLARDWYRRAAEAGDRDAAFRLGRLLHQDGDETEALRWTRAAAEAGQADAMFALGNACAEGGQGVPRDEAQALDWYRRAAERNQPEALQALGLAYLRGELGLPRDEQRGRELIAVSGEMSEHRLGGLFSR